MLSGLSETRIKAAEGGATWSAYDVVGHLIHGLRKVGNVCNRELL